MNSPLLFEEVNSQTEFESILQVLEYPFTQGFAYGEWHRRSGRNVRRFVVRDGSKIISIFQIIKYSLTFGKNLLYIPHGPVMVDPLPSEFLPHFAQKLQEITKRGNAIFIRFDVFPYDSNIILPAAIPTPSIQSSFIQPQEEWILPLDKSEEELLAAMHPKHRYNIRLAERKGIAIEIITNDFLKYFETFYQLLSETAKRDGFHLHSKRYYRAAFETGEEYKNLWLVLARHQEKILVANLIVLFGKNAYYAFGGSADENRNLMAPHLAHYQAIKRALQKGYKVYNLGGISDSNPDWQGLSLFKKRFGGEILHYNQSYDLISQPIWHKLYQWRQKYS